MLVTFAELTPFCVMLHTKAFGQVDCLVEQLLTVLDDVRYFRQLRGSCDHCYMCICL